MEVVGMGEVEMEEVAMAIEVVEMAAKRVAAATVAQWEFRVGCSTIHRLMRDKR
jgi:hypothetical protein